MTYPANDDIRTNAYVDRELDCYERAAFLEELVRNPVRSREVAELSELNELIRLAFDQVPGAPRNPFAEAPISLRAKGPWRGLRTGLLIVALLVTFGAGWLASWGVLSQRSASSAPAQARQAVHARQAPGMVLVLASASRVKANATLHRARQLLERYSAHGRRIEVVVTGLAINFLRRGSSHESAAFTKLMRQYPDLKVVACEATLEALGGGHKRMLLLKRVDLVPTAVDEVVKRLQQGWIYVKA